MVHCTVFLKKGASWRQTFFLSDLLGAYLLPCVCVCVGVWVGGWVGGWVRACVRACLQKVRRTESTVRTPLKPVQPQAHASVEESREGFRAAVGLLPSVLRGICTAAHVVLLLLPRQWLVTVGGRERCPLLTLQMVDTGDGLGKRSALEAALSHVSGHGDLMAAVVSLVGKLPNIVPRAFEVLIGIIGANPDSTGGPRYLLLLKVLDDAFGKRHSSVMEVCTLMTGTGSQTPLASVS